MEKSPIAKASSIGCKPSNPKLAVAPWTCTSMSVCFFTLCCSMKPRAATAGLQCPPHTRRKRTEAGSFSLEMLLAYFKQGSVSCHVFLSFLCSNYNFKINFFFISKFHLVSCTKISCRERIQTIG